MATITDQAIPAGETPIEATGATRIPFQVSLDTSVANGDDVNVLTVPAGFVAADAVIGPSATLGAGCTVAGRIGTTAVTGATTATSTALVRMSEVFDQPSDSDRIFNLLVSGANVTSAALVRGFVDLVRAVDYGLTANP